MRVPHIPVLFLSVFLLTACGGGSGGDSGGDPGGSGTSEVGSRPDRGKPNYDGSREYAELTEFDAVRQVSMIFSFLLNAQAARVSPVMFDVDEETEINETVPGPGGGSARVKGVIEPDGTGWYTLEYDGWQFRDTAEDETYTVFNGKILIEVVAGDPSAHVYVSYYDFETDTNEAPPVVLNGYIDRYHSDDGLSFTTNLSVQQESTVLLDGVTVFYPDSLIGMLPTLQSLDMEGSVYLSGYGRVDLSMNDIGFSGLNYCSVPVAIPVREAGFANDRRMRIHLLGNEALGLELDLDGDGIFEKGRRVTLEEVITGTNPMVTQSPQEIYVTAGAGRTPATGQDTLIESGLLSDTGSERFLRYDWRLFQRPGARQDELLDVTLPVPSLIADASQDRVLEVTVTDGQQQERDYTTIYQSCDSFDYLEYHVPRLGNLPDAEPGETVWLDGRNLAGFSWVSSSLDDIDLWRMTPPTGSTAALANRAARVTSFVPDVAGTYRIEAQRRKTPTGTTGEWVHVGDVHAGAGIDVTSTSSGWLPEAADGGVVLDIDGDGNSDFAGTSRTFAPDSSWLAISLGGDEGYGLEMHEKVLDFYDYGVPVILDVNGDGRDEIAYMRAPEIDAIFIDLAADKTSFTPLVTTISNVTGTCDSQGAGEPAVGDVNNDGFDDLVVRDDCAQEFPLLLSDGSALQPPVARPAASVSGKPYLRDVNGDGNLDLAVIGGTPGGDRFISVQEGNGHGTFAAEYVVGPVAGCCQDVNIAQLDDDAALEIAVEEGSEIVGYDIRADHSTQELLRWNDVSQLAGWADIDGDGHEDLIGCSDRGPLFSLKREGGSWSAAIVVGNAEDYCGFSAYPLFRFGGRTIVRGAGRTFFIH